MCTVLKHKLSIKKKKKVDYLLAKAGNRRWVFPLRGMNSGMKSGEFAPDSGEDRYMKLRRGTQPVAHTD